MKSDKITYVRFFPNTYSRPVILVTWMAVVIGCFTMSESTTTATGHVQGPVREYCQWEKFAASCSADSVIVMETARYGRMAMGRCITYDLGYLGCSSDVLDIADMSCSGRRRCEIAVPSQHLDRVNPCLSELKNYLQASYRCQKVITADALMCRSTNLVKVLPTYGFLSNLVPGTGTRPGSAGGGGGDSDCAGDSSPQWLIEAQPGQRISINLWDFGRRILDSELSHHQQQQLSGQPGCIKYATLTEVGPEAPSGPARVKAICGGIVGVDGAERRRQIYVSITSAVQVQLHVLAHSESTGASNSYSPHFLFEYRMQGCPDLILPDQAFFNRHGDTATAGCVAAGPSNTLTLICNGTNWIGDVQPLAACQHDSGNLQVLDSLKFPLGSSVVLIIGLSLLVGLIVLAIGLLYLCRRWRRQSAGHLDRHPSLDIGDGSYSRGDLIGATRPHAQQKAFGQLAMTSHQQSRSDDIMTSANRQVHRESNEYASIWEWPLPNTPITGATGDMSTPAAAVNACTVGGSRIPPDCDMTSSRDVRAHYGTYETRQFDTSTYDPTSCRRIEHPYQRPGTPSSSGGRFRSTAGADPSMTQTVQVRAPHRYCDLSHDDLTVVDGNTALLSSASAAAVGLGGLGLHGCGTAPPDHVTHLNRAQCYGQQQYDVMARHASCAQPPSSYS